MNCLSARASPFARTGIWNAVFGGWQVAATYEWQPGGLLDWGNPYYTGDREQYQ